jgi:hypothetical protein
MSRFRAGVSKPGHETSVIVHSSFEHSMPFMTMSQLLTDGEPM